MTQATAMVLLLAGFLVANYWMIQMILKTLTITMILRILRILRILKILKILRIPMIPMILWIQKFCFIAWLISKYLVLIWTIKC